MKVDKLLLAGSRVVATLVLGSGLAATSTVTVAETVTYNTNVLGIECGTSLINNQNAVEPLVESAGCADAQATQLYKSNQGGADDGSFLNSYNTEYFLAADDPSAATISHIIGTPAINCLDFSCFLAVKDGNANPAIYAFEIFDWDGLSDIVLVDFWPGSGAISNVSIWSSADVPNSQIPEPGSLALVGLAFVGAAFAQRRSRNG